MITKICKLCGISKTVDLFHKQSSCKYGVKAKCADCCNLIAKDRYSPEKKKEYRDANKERASAYNKEYRVSKKDELNHKNKLWREANKDHIREKNRIYTTKKRQTDPLFKLTNNIRRLISLKIRQNGYTKKSRTYEILGCTYEEFKAHLESKFEPWMTWDNYGLYNGEQNYGWDIDHVVPVSSAENEEGVIALNHYTNLQPLCSKINRDIKRSAKGRCAFL